ncbi:hypothetical protein IWQ60_004276 [Tieghemiomyces parasiticus]|uniref:Uncharacterized protein n=1 Tax=Tieghemiomyces parasiticus TaxID=78921 RepID=A0A9W8AG57_9FUNG|nr:hypothetical protein IWQ60_004276 [Tieghemiomyces parasiticus]
MRLSSPVLLLAAVAVTWTTTTHLVRAAIPGPGEVVSLGPLETSRLADAWHDIIHYRLQHVNYRTTDVYRKYMDALFFSPWDDFLPFFRPYYKGYSPRCPQINRATLGHPTDEDFTSCFMPTDTVLSNVTYNDYRELDDLFVHYPLFWPVLNGQHGLVHDFIITLWNRVKYDSSLAYGTTPGRILVYSIVRDITRLAIVERRPGVFDMFSATFRQLLIEVSELLVKDYIGDLNPTGALDAELQDLPWTGIRDITIGVADGYSAVLYLWANALYGETAPDFVRVVRDKVTGKHEPFLSALKTEAAHHALPRYVDSFQSLGAVMCYIVLPQAYFDDTPWRAFVRFEPVNSFDPRGLDRLVLPVP